MFIAHLPIALEWNERMAMAVMVELSQILIGAT